MDAVVGSKGERLMTVDVQNGAARKRAAVALVGLVAGGVLVAGAALPASADTAPAAGVPVTAGTDVLPTVQVNGVVWSQAIVGNTVYAGGSFTSARPAGSALGVNETARGNLLAYDITTGNLIASFAPNLNGQVRSVTASPDGSRIYVGGDFTTADGVSRSRIAAYDTATGQLIASFAPKPQYTVTSVVATADTVYLGGDFNGVGSVTRNKLAAVSAADGSLLPWAPAADATVRAMVLSPDGSRVIVGGSFQNINGSAAYGLGAVDATTGALLPWAANQSVRDAGANAAITSLTSDGTSIYGTGYVFGAGGNLEGTFSADPNSGSLNWVEDCHGDSYSSYATGGAIYVVGHSHECSTVPGGFSQTDPWTYYRGVAFSTTAAGTLGKTPYSSYKNWAGTPAPAQLHWYPTLSPGTVTGQSQAAWNVTGNGRYVVLAGEFPKVNGIAQQGLVRMALPSTQPSKTAPVNAGNAFTPVFSQPAPGTVKVSWQANYDRDNEQLTYKLVRNGNTAAPIYTTTLGSKPWLRPAMSFTDTGLVVGQTYTYRLYAVDPNGNSAPGTALSVTVGSDTAYANAVKADGANRYWRMSEPAGSTIAFDSIASGDGYGNIGVTAGGGGAIVSEPAGHSYAFNGTSGVIASQDAVAGPQTFTAEAWFKTTSAKGGKIIGFGNNANGLSSSYDRHVYLDNAGHLVFGVYSNNTVRTVASAGTYTDGGWHQVAATLGVRRDAPVRRRRRGRCQPEHPFGPGLQRLLEGRRGQPQRLDEPAEQQLPRRQHRRGRGLPDAALRRAGERALPGQRPLSPLDTGDRRPGPAQGPGLRRRSTARAAPVPALGSAAEMPMKHRTDQHQRVRPRQHPGGVVSRRTKRTPGATTVRAARYSRSRGCGRGGL